MAAMVSSLELCRVQVSPPILPGTLAQGRLNLGRGSKEDLCLCFAEPLQNILDVNPII